MHIALLSDNPLWCHTTAALLQQDGWQVISNENTTTNTAAPIIIALHERHISIQGHGIDMPLPVSYGKLAQHLRMVWAQIDPLTDKERAIVAALQQAGDAGMTTTQLLQTVWLHHTDAHAVATHMNRLRMKLAAEQIITTDGVYYWRTV